MLRYFTDFKFIILAVAFGLGGVQIGFSSNADLDDDQERNSALVRIDLTSRDSLNLLQNNSSPLDVFEPNYAGPIDTDVLDALGANAQHLVKFHMRNPTFALLQRCRDTLGNASNLQVFSTLTYGGNEMDDSCYALIAGLIPQWKNLRALNFTSSNFGNAAADVVLPTLYGSNSIEVLALAFDNWQQDCVLSCLSRHHFERLLNTCPRLMAFNIAGTCFTRGTHLENPNKRDVEDSSCISYYAPGDNRIDTDSSLSTKQVLEEVSEWSDMCARAWFKKTFPARTKGADFDIWYDGLCYVLPLGYEVPNLEGEGALPSFSHNAEAVVRGVELIRAAYQRENESLPKTGEAISLNFKDLTEIWVNN